jgi:hypothetical protein
VHPPAVALLGLIGSFDGDFPCCLEPNGTAVVYPTVASRSMIPLVSLHPSASGLAAPTGLCYNPGPEAGWIGSTEPTQYKSHKPHSYMSPLRCLAKVTTPLPDFGTDRMGDFERVGTANLWKSGPLFSTGADNSEPGFSGASIEASARQHVIQGLLREQRSRRRWAVILIPGCPQHLQKPAATCPQRRGGREVSRETGPAAQGNA